LPSLHTGDGPGNGLRNGCDCRSSGQYANTALPYPVYQNDSSSHTPQVVDSIVVKFFRVIEPERYRAKP
jgi:hypothetical protein